MYERLTALEFVKCHPTLRVFHRSVGSTKQPDFQPPAPVQAHSTAADQFVEACLNGIAHRVISI